MQLKKEVLEKFKNILLNEEDIEILATKFNKFNFDFTLLQDTDLLKEKLDENKVDLSEIKIKDLPQDLLNLESTTMMGMFQSMNAKKDGFDTVKHFDTVHTLSHFITEYLVYKYTELQGYGLVNLTDETIQEIIEKEKELLAQQEELLQLQIDSNVEKEMDSLKVQSKIEDYFKALLQSDIKLPVIEGQSLKAEDLEDFITTINQPIQPNFYDYIHTNPVNDKTFLSEIDLDNPQFEEELQKDMNEAYNESLDKIFDNSFENNLFNNQFKNPNETKTFTIKDFEKTLNKYNKMSVEQYLGYNITATKEGICFEGILPVCKEYYTGKFNEGEFKTLIADMQEYLNTPLDNLQKTIAHKFENFTVKFNFDSEHEVESLEIYKTPKAPKIDFDLFKQFNPSKNAEFDNNFGHLKDMFNVESNKKNSPLHLNDVQTEALKQLFNSLFK